MKALVTNRAWCDLVYAVSSIEGSVQLEPSTSMAAMPQWELEPPKSTTSSSPSSVLDFALSRLQFTSLSLGRHSSKLDTDPPERTGLPARNHAPAAQPWLNTKHPKPPTSHRQSCQLSCAAPTKSNRTPSARLPSWTDAPPSKWPLRHRMPTTISTCACPPPLTNPTSISPCLPPKTTIFLTHKTRRGYTLPRRILLRVSTGLRMRDGGSLRPVRDATRYPLRIRVAHLHCGIRGGLALETIKANT